MRIRFGLVVTLAAALVWVSAARAEYGPAEKAFEKSLVHKTGQITLGSNLATLNLSAKYHYLDPQQAEKLLVEGWGNPPGQNTLGMIIPADVPVMSDAGWGVVITYIDEGHVKDEDADEIDYDELLQSMKEADEEAAPELRKQGYPVLTIVGWAKTPSYDSATKKMYWAKDIVVEGATEHTLNYDVRVLGRTGVLSLNAVGAMSQLSQIDRDMQQVLPMVSFNAGNRYEDFDESTDKLATYGVAGLVAGGVAAKAGLFKGLIAMVLAGKKFLIIGLIALAAFGKKILGAFTGRKATS